MPAALCSSRNLVAQQRLGSFSIMVVQPRSHVAVAQGNDRGDHNAAKVLFVDEALAGLGRK